MDHYHQTLKKNQRAKDYLKKRGIYNEVLIDRFKIGCADRTLHNILDKNAKELALELGLIKAKNNCRFEAFNGCVTFTIFNESAIAEITGRKIRDDQKPGSPLHLHMNGSHQGVFNSEAFAGKELVICEAVIDALTFMANRYHECHCRFWHEWLYAASH